MLCSKCNKNNASVFYQESLNGKSRDLALCHECAGKMGITTGDSLFNGFFKIPSIARTAPVGNKVCSLCASNENNFIKGGKISCPECYNTFREELASPIKRIHGNVSHIGRAPAKLKRQNDKKLVLEELKKKLNEAIKNQAFEDAAVLRDKIRDIEAEG